MDNFDRVASVGAPDDGEEGLVVGIRGHVPVAGLQTPDRDGFPVE
jgi:hypothetical protein